MSSCPDDQQLLLLPLPRVRAQTKADGNRRGPSRLHRTSTALPPPPITIITTNPPPPLPPPPHSAPLLPPPRSPLAAATTATAVLRKGDALIPQVPRIPAHFLKTGRPASIASPACAGLSAPASARDTTPSPTSHYTRRPSTSPGETSHRETRSGSLTRSASLNGRRNNPSDRCGHDERIATEFTARHVPQQLPGSTPVTVDARRADALSRLESRAPNLLPGEMERPGRGPSRDNHFLEFDNDRMAEHDGITQLRRSESRLSQARKRRSLPADALVTSFTDQRPSTTDYLYARPTSRLNTTSNRAANDLQRHVDQYRSPTSRASQHLGDTVSVSGLSDSGRARRFSIVSDRSPVPLSVLRERIGSPELSQLDRLRPSFGAMVSDARLRDQVQSSPSPLDSQGESPTEGSEPKQTDSASNDSQTADTVWDELDDLKSRIKKLEFPGKTTEISSAAVLGDVSDRPHTATTTPTTVDSSPKQDRKQRQMDKVSPTTPAAILANVAEGNTSRNATPTAHNMLQAALAKAKPLLNRALYRTLEATANDALQLAAMTAGSGLQGTTYTTASTINGFGVSDRHVRRKADTMCRSLTDLCLTLCEGKHENATMIASPISLHSPSIRHAASDVGRRVTASRPMSRLEARRSSILGLQPAGSSESLSPRDVGNDGPVSEQTTTSTPTYLLQPRRVSREPNSLRSRYQEDVSGDENPTIRPPSRAMTDIGALRTRPRNAAEDRSPIRQRTPSLRETLTTKRANESAFEFNRETPRRTSLGSENRRRRLFDQQSTPPVMEEEDSPSQYYSSSQPGRRIASTGQFSSSRRTTADFARSPSLNHRRHIIAE